MWETAFFFCSSNSTKGPSYKLRNFLNEKNIKEFKIIEVDDLSIEIIYLES